MFPPAIMGIVNVTPDSFSDRGQFVDPTAAIAHGERLAADGAAILDIGGEASGPGSSPCDAETEWARIEPVVAALSTAYTISIDTYKPAVAERALRAGARIINDISALRYDPAMAGLIKSFNASVVLMFSKERAEHPLVSESSAEYSDVVAEIKKFLSNRIEFALSAGLRADQIILDSGMGRFVSHDNRYSWEIINRYGELRSEFKEFRFLFGSSRKGFLGGTLADRDGLSQMTGLVAAIHGADFIRTHNVAMARDFFAAWYQLSKSR